MIAATILDKAKRATKKSYLAFHHNSFITESHSNVASKEGNTGTQSDFGGTCQSARESWLMLVSRLLEKHNRKYFAFAKLPISIHKVFVEAQARSGIALTLFEKQFCYREYFKKSKPNGLLSAELLEDILSKPELNITLRKK